MTDFKIIIYIVVLLHGFNFLMIVIITFVFLFLVTIIEMKNWRHRLLHIFTTREEIGRTVDSLRY